MVKDAQAIDKQQEVVPVKMRAGLVDIHAVLLVFGYTVQGWIGFGFYFWKNGSYSQFIIMTHLTIAILPLDFNFEVSAYRLA